MSTSPILPVVNTKDLPSIYDDPAFGVGIIETAEVAPSQSGEYQRVHLALKYPAPNGSERTAHVRFNLKPEWLQPGFSQKVKAGMVDEKEALQYRINVAGFWRSLFVAAGMDSTDMTQLPGKRIGFVIDYRYDKATGLPKNDAPEIQQFFSPDKYDAVKAKIEKAAADRAGKLGASSAALGSQQPSALLS